MVSLLCGCCGDKPITSFRVNRVFCCSFDVEPTDYRAYEIKKNGEHALIAYLNGFVSPVPPEFSTIFQTEFYMANFSNSRVDQANVPLHQTQLDDDDFKFSLGADFLTPLGKTTIVELPTISEISNYLVPELIFNGADVSDYFYFFVSAVFDFSRYFNDLSFSSPDLYLSSSPFFNVGGVPTYFSFFKNAISNVSFHYTPKFLNLCSQGFIYDFDAFIPIFKQGFLSAYSKFSNDVINYNYHRSYFSVFRFSKKDYYAHLQNNSTAG